MPKVNELWAANVLNMEINPGNGPDLIDGNMAVEIKFKLIYPDKYTHLCWRTLGHQVEYKKDYEKIYWGFGTYTLDKSVSEVDTKNKEKLEKIVRQRTLHIVQWGWINQFPHYHHKGKTDISEWDHYILFPKARLIPEITHEFEIEKGTLFLTKGVNPRDFSKVCSIS